MSAAKRRKNMNNPAEVGGHPDLGPLGASGHEPPTTNRPFWLVGLGSHVVRDRRGSRPAHLLRVSGVTCEFVTRH
jgi:hypothetical protein